MNSDVRLAARAAVRVGILQAMLHPDAIEALRPPGIIVESMRDELTHRWRELSAVEISPSDLADLDLHEKGPQ